eukprot:CAMPEP_0181091632 /NCGR_PEP_ID=MMETSP1071-20121207/8499_1 /TAXON_ID=35127 /ORGANISM="Thalassiosira sp., Strain NH16" /LENGTH=316 /DNA_ID=CAMNT_0023173779 /DNA_START=20 /DNA_END=970 /DNA_ORIENTATION=+
MTMATNGNNLHHSTLVIGSGRKQKMMKFAYFLSVLASVLPAAAGFASMRPRVSHISITKPKPHSKLTERLRLDDDEFNFPQDKHLELKRRDAIGQACHTAVAIAASAVFAAPTISRADIEGVVTIPQSTAPPEATASKVEGTSVTVFKTKSGLQYIDLAEGTGSSPKYGNFVSIIYKAYIKLPDAQGKPFKLDEFDSDKGYLVKHGNGRTVPGLDEGLHTMKVGGKRRIIIPPKLGYVSSGIGPIPVGPYGRWKLNRLLDRMVELKGGNLIFDVEMRNIMEDEADQGYYDDQSLTPEDFNTLRQNIESSQQEARSS